MPNTTTTPEMSGWSFDSGDITVEKDAMSIKFDERPNQDVLNEVKSAGFIWNHKEQSWIGPCNEETYNTIKNSPTFAEHTFAPLHTDQEQLTTEQKELMTFQGGKLTADKNSITLTFDEKPEKEVLNSVKQAGFKWNHQSQSWKMPMNEDALEIFRSGQQPEVTEQKTENQGWRFANGEVAVDNGDITIGFSTKPDKEVLDEVKSAGFKWEHKSQLWAAPMTDDRYKAVQHMDILKPVVVAPAEKTEQTQDTKTQDTIAQDMKPVETELEAKYDRHNSFYGKATVVKTGNVEELKSYGEVVGRMTDGQLDYANMSSSQTTRRHVREWLKQHDIDPAQVDKSKLVDPNKQNNDQQKTKSPRYKDYGER